MGAPTIQEERFALQGHALIKEFGEGEAAVTAVTGVSIGFARGDFVAVMGPSGSGKSTLMNLLSGLDTPTSGRVTVEGTDLAKLDDRELTRLRRERIGFVFQAFNLLPTLTARQNILLPLEVLCTAYRMERRVNAWADSLRPRGLTLICSAPTLLKYVTVRKCEKNFRALEGPAPEGKDDRLPSRRRKHGERELSWPWT